MSTTPPAADAPAWTDLPDLAVDTAGGAALACNDEFFAEKEALLRPHPAEWREGVYTDRGKWMDGWETRRRREPGYDWCVIRLGMPGVIRGVVVDTAFFRGNFPESCSLEATTVDDVLDLRALADATWTELVARTPLRGDSKNYLAVSGEQRFTHVRFNIFPDGGVARLRIHGEARPRWDRQRALGAVTDLAALEAGAVVETCSDMFFGSRNNLIKPGPSRSMADGWETRRRRGPGNDWAIVRLAAYGTVERLEIDTSHFKGNAPGRCVVEGVYRPGTPADKLTGWRELLSTPLQPHTRHLFDDLRRIGEISHLRLSVFPDGGVARLRVWGTPSPAPQPGLARLNALPVAEATEALLRCCGSRKWAETMAQRRPFEDEPTLLRLGERLWWTLGEADWLEAFAAHPRIGERKADDAAPAWSSQEQRGAAGASAEVAAKLAAGNDAYLAKYGFIYIVCATGRSAEDMLGALECRLAGDRTTELRTAAEEQAAITRLRLRKLIGGVG
ncbi:MAG: allantoicase [Kofleriaceae bacterium]|jgi:allantoicase|nr:allantoicase [Kofleriaceae bacterium]